MMESAITKKGLCPSPEVLKAFNLGILPSEEIDRVAAHLEECPSCLDVLQKLDDCTDDLVLGIRQTDREKESGNEGDTHIIVDRVKHNYSLLDPSTAILTSLIDSKTLKHLGPYEILEPLGEGGMGNIFKVRHTHLGKIMALKLLSPERIKSQVAVVRFQNEMKAIGQLDHPNIVRAHHAEVNGTPYIAMEFVEGIDLSRLVEKNGPLSISDACTCIRQAALALQHAHEFHLVHRDIKPSNLMVTRNGEIKLLDLGLALLRTEPAEDSKDHHSGSITFMGTLDYVAPEQLLNCQKVDIRADLYSLGCTLFHLLTGEAPFAKEDRYGKQQAHLLTPPPDIRKLRPDIPEELAMILNCLLSKDPEERYDSPAELAIALDSFTTEKCVTESLDKISTEENGLISSGTHKVQRPMPRKDAQVPWLAILFFGLFLVGAFFLIRPTFFSESPELIESFKAELNKILVDDNIPVGQLSNPIEPDEFVQISADFSEPCYCYLVEIFPDGSDRLRFPSQPDQKPNGITSLKYPQKAKPFTQKGFHAYVLVVSREPLPSYRAWRDRHLPSVKWPTEAKGVWRFDGRIFTNLSSESQPHSSSVVPKELKEFCTIVRQRPGITALRAVAFPVLNPQKGDPTPSP